MVLFFKSMTNEKEKKTESVNKLSGNNDKRLKQKKKQLGGTLVNLLSIYIYCV
jgi:hypothetical protein